MWGKKMWVGLIHPITIMVKKRNDTIVLFRVYVTSSSRKNGMVIWWDEVGWGRYIYGIDLTHHHFMRILHFLQKLMKNDDEMRSVYSCGIDPKFHHSFVVTFLHLQRMFRRVEKSFTAGNFMADHGWCAEPLAAVDGVLNPLLQAWAWWPAAMERCW